MKLSRIRELLAMLPRNMTYLSRITSNSVGGYDTDEETDIWAFVRNDPLFGFKFVKSFCEIRRALPDEVYEPALWRLFCLREEKKPGRDLNIVEACALTNPRLRVIRTIIECMLMHPEVELESIAKLCDYPVDVIELFHELFFNVRDRLDEEGASDDVFHLSLVYPESRQVEFYPDYHLQEGWPQIARRIAYNYGLTALFQWLGARTSDKEDHGIESLQAIESRIASSAMFAMNCGFQHQPGVIAITRARQLLRSSNRAGQDTADNRAPVSPTMAEGALAVLRKIIASAAQERLQIAKKQEAWIASLTQQSSASQPVAPVQKP